MKTIKVPWAGKNSRFTLMFEAFGIAVLQARSNVKRAAQLLGLHWDSVHLLIERAVQRPWVQVVQKLSLENPVLLRKARFNTPALPLNSGKNLKWKVANCADSI